MNKPIKTIPSKKGGVKINVGSYLITKESNRKDTYYWCCDKRKDRCKDHAVTKLLNNTHIFKSFTKHNSHALEVHKVEIAKITDQIKRQARETQDKPVKIVQDTVINTQRNFVSIFHY
ncbi:6894_t:CDS:1 [Dentiscutata heterogama]|uniref:6894_t:CDS:1 n=1 Tax=Dentiscutata heterogama TaxID=1316150 RepID=A0ACA9LR53_9GLOM|nr:6894_t:CDS:1 [Dentiscutata heterogama]